MKIDQVIDLLRSKKGRITIVIALVIQFLIFPILNNFEQSGFNSNCKNLWQRNLEDLKQFQSDPRNYMAGYQFLTDWIQDPSERYEMEIGSLHPCFTLPKGHFSEQLEAKQVHDLHVVLIEYYRQIQEGSNNVLPPDLSQLRYDKIESFCRIPNPLALRFNFKCGAFLAEKGHY